MLETDAHKKHNFQYYCENKMSQIIVFWSNCEIKMPQNVVFKLNREIRKLFKKLAKSKCRENFMPRKFFTLKLPMLLSPNISSKTSPTHSPTPPLAPSFYESKWKKHQVSIEVIGWVYPLLSFKDFTSKTKHVHTLPPYCWWIPNFLFWSPNLLIHYDPYILHHENLFLTFSSLTTRPPVIRHLRVLHIILVLKASIKLLERT